MSEMAMRRLTISRPLGVRTLRLRLRLFTLVSLKFPEVFRFTSRSCGVVELGNLPRSFSGHSILIISAPRAPNQRVAHGPARTQLKSTTRIPSRARGRDMASCSLQGCHLHEQFGHRILPPPGAPTFFKTLSPFLLHDRGCGPYTAASPHRGFDLINLRRLGEERL